MKNITSREDDKGHMITNAHKINMIILVSVYFKFLIKNFINRRREKIWE